MLGGKKDGVALVLVGCFCVESGHGNGKHSGVGHWRKKPGLYEVPNILGSQKI